MERSSLIANIPTYTPFHVTLSGQCCKQSLLDISPTGGIFSSPQNREISCKIQTLQSQKYPPSFSDALWYSTERAHDLTCTIVAGFSQSTIANRYDEVKHIILYMIELLETHGNCDSDDDTKLLLDMVRKYYDTWQEEF